MPTPPPTPPYDTEFVDGDAPTFRNGTPGRDRMVGNGGADNFRGGAGDDVLEGGADADFLQGEAGNDYIDGGDADDNLRGGAGDDTVLGGLGNDFLRGGSGIDILNGGDGDDRISFFDFDATQGVVADLAAQTMANDGYGNSETLISIEGLGAGTRFVDTFLGNDGANLLLANSDDIFDGRGGDDMIQVGASATGGGTITGGAGTDMLQFTADYLADTNGDGIAEVIATTLGVSVNLTLASNQLVNDGNNRTATISGIENLGGTNFADSLIGSNGANVIDGFGGNDVLFGIVGNDTLRGGAGSDTILDWFGGNDIIDGGEEFDGTTFGFDIVNYLNGSPPPGQPGVTVDLRITTAQTTGRGSDTITNVEGIIGTRGADTLTGDESDNIFWGSGGPDTLIGNGGDDGLVVAGFGSVVDGGADDLAVGNAIENGDTIVFWTQTGSPNGAPIEISSGVTLDLSIDGVAQASAGGSLTVSGIEHISGSRFDDVLTGDTADNNIGGSFGNDTIGGGDGDDNLFGDGTIQGDGLGNFDYLDTVAPIGAFNLGTAAGEDTITGGAGDDRIFGGGGDDAITGGTGDDTVFGGDGEDEYFYNARTDGSDTVDLGAGQDDVIVSGGGQVRITLSFSGIGNGNPNDPSALVPYDGGLAIRVQAEDETGALVGNVSRFDDEGIGFLATADDTTLDVRILENGTQIGVYKGFAAGTGGDDVLDATDFAGNVAIVGAAGNDTLTGSTGNDYIQGGAGIDVMSGGEGNDSLIDGGGGGTKTYLGGAGQDRAFVNILANNTNFIDLGASVVGAIDIVNVQGPSNVGEIRLTLDAAAAGNGNPLDGGGNLAVTMQREDANGNLTGAITRGDDEHILYNSPNGSAGFDVRDSVTGASYGVYSFAYLGGDFADVDTALSPTRSYFYSLGAGDDAVTGGDLGDYINGGIGNDTLNGGLGDDKLFGQSGNDSLNGGAGFDLLEGGDGNDILEGGLDVDVMRGGRGDDVYFVDRSGDGGDSFVELSDEGTDEVRTSVDLGINNFADIENVTAIGTANIFLGGNGAANVITGNTGNNYIVGEGGNDSIDGGGNVPDGSNSGRDIASYQLAAGTPGNVVQVAGTGADAGKILVQIVDGANVQTFLKITLTGQGSGTVEGVGLGAYMGTDTLTNIEELHIFVRTADGSPTPNNQFLAINTAINVFGAGVAGSEGADTIDLGALPGTQNASGNGGNDSIIGTNADNNLQGNAGDDSIQGLAGNDYLIGGAGNDTVDGGTGSNDIVAFNLPEGTPGSYRYVDGTGVNAGKLLVERVDGATVETVFIVTLSGGTATVQGVGTAAFLGTDTVTNVDQLHFLPIGPFDPNRFVSISVSAQQFGDFVAGSESSDTIDLAAFPGAVNAAGNRGDDSIIGTDAANILSGNGGNDAITGRGGNDSIDGFDGTDVAVFAKARASYAVVSDGGSGFLVIDRETLEQDVVRNIETLRFADGDFAPASIALNRIATNPGTANEGRNGTANGDYLLGNDGYNTLTGQGGDDFIVTGNNPATTGNQVDIAQGGAGNDTLVGGAGNDLFRGGQGVDRFFGQGGTDRISFFETAATQGVVADLQAGLISNDGFGNVESISGIEGLGGSTRFADTFLGDDEINLLLGDSSDTIRGRGGDDRIQLSGSTAGGGTIDGGDGLDFVNFFTADKQEDTNADGIADSVTTNVGVSIDLSQGRILNDGFGNSATIVNIEGITGGNFNDTLIGDDAANRFGFTTGADSIDGRGGVDLIDTNNAARAEFTVVANGTGYTINFSRTQTVFVVNPVTGVSEPQTVTTTATFNTTNVERILFAEGEFALADLAAPSTTPSEGNDTLTGTANADTINALGGDDTIDALGGNDTIDGGAGTDVAIFAKASTSYAVVGNNVGGFLVIDRDTLEQDSVTNVETLRFSNGDFAPAAIALNRIDTPAGTTNDGRNGTANGDYIVGNDGYNFLQGLNGDDFIVAGGNGGAEPSVDNIRGDNGNDTLVGGTGADLLRGGAGVDRFFGGGGNDRISLNEVAATQGVVADLATGTIENDGFGNVETFTGIEGLGGVTRFADTLRGDDNGNFFVVDTMDTLLGRGGDDTIQLQGSTSGGGTIDGGDGFDRITVFVGNKQEDTNGDGIADVVNATQGVSVDLTQQRILNDGFGNSATLVSIEATGGSALNDLLVGSDGDNRLTLSNGVDFLDGRGGIDTIGASAIARADLTIARTGANEYRITGFSGGIDTTVTNVEQIDLLEGTFSIASLAVPGPGNDYVEGTAGDDVLDGLSGNDTILGLGGNDTLNGGDGIDTLNGGNGNDIVNGGGGNDIITDGAGGNQLRGDDGDDVITTTNGLNTIAPGAGNDVVNGGLTTEVITSDIATGGADRYNTGGAIDFVTFNMAAGSEARVTFTSSEVGNGSAFDSNTAANQDGDLAVRIQLEDGAGNSIGPVTRGDDEGVYYTASEGSTVEVRDLVSGVSRGSFRTAFLGTSANDTITPTGSFVDQSLYANGGGGNDSLNGSSVNDFLVGGAGDDVLRGALGNDRFIGGIGGDEITGGDGDDTAIANVATDGTDNVNLGNGADTVLLSGAPQIRLSFTSNEVANGVAVDAGTQANQDGNLAVRVQGEDGSGALIGAVARYDDEGVTFIAGDGVRFDIRDLVSGAERGDFFQAATLGTFLDDTVVASPVLRSYINGGAGNDSITGSGENDFLVGASGNDNIAGGDGKDTLIGGEGIDALTGGAGDDTIDGGQEADTLTGGSGNDTYIAEENDTIVELAGEGLDTVLSARSHVLAANVENLNLSGTAVFGTGNADNNVINGTGEGNVLRGDGGNDTLSGFAGNDQLLGEAGDDLLNGGDSNDEIDGGAGRDTMIGGAGDDLYVVDDAADQVVELAGEGTFDRIRATVSYSLGADSEVEALSLVGPLALTGVGSSTDNGISGNEFDNTLYGRGGDDLLKGAAGNDRLLGDEGDDDLRGGTGDDVLDGGVGADLMIGGTGNDAYYIDDSGDFVIENVGGGTDELLVSVSYTMVGEVETASLTGTGNLSLTGSETANTVFGNSGANVIDGADGNDFLYGLAGDDTLIGGNGDDFLRGGDGLDIFVGGAGIDTMRGNSGADIFRFAATSDSGTTAVTGDRILDFTSAQGDRIDLAAIDANTLNGAADDAFTFIGAGAFTGAAGQLRVEVSGGNQIVSGDTNGDGLADFVIVVTAPGGVPLVNTDFLL